MDVGTNTYLNGSVVRADRPFNGIDFPFSEPTGRFSNGYNTADLLVRLLSENYKRSPPPFLSLLRHNSTFKRKLLLGANFASGGSGILNTTGKVFVEVVSLGDQIQQFSTAVANITELLGQDKAAALISSNSLYIISVGSNDIFEYQRNASNVSNEAFLSTLHDEYLSHLKNLYNLGARKFGIISAPAIGCCPYERYLNQLYNNGSGGCYDEMNDLAQSFYNLTEIILQEFSSQCSGVVYSLGNAYQATMDAINNPLPFGLKDVQTPCCTSGTFTDLGLCTQSDNLCRNREDYLFWDWYHPTQHASQLAALTLYGAAPPFVTPVNFSQLVL
ncbi:GDSL esterase/lipase At4g28780-like isoform X2 [Diospyros lotus]|nr:GDSL esterase/lipase At4g28780-like isoform X2 [Diospyros lotus]